MLIVITHALFTSNLSFRMLSLRAFCVEFAAGTLRNAARARRTVLPSSGDTMLLSQQSEHTEVSVDNAMSTQSTVQPTLASNPGRRVPTAREIVDEEHLCTLIAAYNLHFERYSQTKVNVTQTIPALVWKNTYATYLEAHPNSVFRQESLKDRLRDTLKELETGNSNAKNAEKAALQSHSVMASLRCTDGHARRNVLRKRATILQSTAEGLDLSDEGSGDSDTGPHFNSDSTAGGKTPGGTGAPKKSKIAPDDKENQPGFQPSSKAHMLQRQSTAIESIAQTFSKSAVKRDALVDLKIISNEAKHNKNRIQLLQTALDLEVIDPAEFKVKVKELCMLGN